MIYLIDLFWRFIALTLFLHPQISSWLIRRAMRTPYNHITSKDGTKIYMRRYWLFNPYGRDANDSQTPAKISWLPSIRLHHILQPDLDRDLHDHPWNARTIVLFGWYTEERHSDGEVDMHVRSEGYTGRLNFEQYHRIDEVSQRGVWTLFITGHKRGEWGFNVDGVKVPWRQYLGLHKENGND